MNLPLHRLVWALPLVWLVAACNGPGNGNVFDPYPNATTVAMKTNNQASLTAVTPNRTADIQAGGSRVYRIDPSQATHQAVYFMAVAEEGFVSIAVEDRNAEPIASSRFPGIFESGGGALSASRQGSLDAQIVVNPVEVTSCIDSCIILARDDLDDARYLVVEAGESEDAVVDLYVVSRDLDDAAEFENNSRVNSEVLGGFAEVNGALETLGDTDWFEAEAVGCLTVAPASQIDIWVSTHDPGGAQRDDRQFDFDTNRTPIETQWAVEPGDYVQVSTSFTTGGADEAGAAESSRYTLLIEGC